MMTRCDAVIGSALITQSFRGLESPLMLAEPRGCPWNPTIEVDLQTTCALDVVPFTWNQQLSANNLNPPLEYRSRHSSRFQIPTEKQMAGSWFQESPVNGDGHTNRQPGTIVQLAVISTGRNHISVPQDDIGLSSTHPTLHRQHVETGAHLEA